MNFPQGQGMMRRRTRARGELEAELLQILWQSENSLSVKDIQQVISPPVPAYTTILTVLDRLVAKGRVTRVGDRPRGVRFAATTTESAHASEAMIKALAASRDVPATLLKFAGDLDPAHIDMLRKALNIPHDQ